MIYANYACSDSDKNVLSEEIKNVKPIGLLRDMLDSSVTFFETDSISTYANVYKAIEQNKTRAIHETLIDNYGITYPVTLYIIKRESGYTLELVLQKDQSINECLKEDIERLNATCVYVGNHA